MELLAKNNAANRTRLPHMIWVDTAMQVSAGWGWGGGVGFTIVCFALPLGWSQACPYTLGSQGFCAFALCFWDGGQKTPPHLRWLCPCPALLLPPTHLLPPALPCSTSTLGMAGTGEQRSRTSVRRWKGRMHGTRGCGMGGSTTWLRRGLLSAWRRAICGHGMPACRCGTSTSQGSAHTGASQLPTTYGCSY